MLKVLVWLLSWCFEGAKVLGLSKFAWEEKVSVASL
jgi:hypothetical protein